MSGDHLKPVGKKPPLAILPLSALQGASRTFAYGARSYGSPYNYRGCPLAEAEEYLHAVLRHLADHQLGILRDVESDLYHLDHAISSLIMYRDILQTHKVLVPDPGPGNDPRERKKEQKRGGKRP